MAMKLTLFSRNLVPTAPQTLHSFPYSKEDPCILKEKPDFYICGNCKEFGQETINIDGNLVKVVAVPRFCEKKELYLMDLNDRSIYCVKYGN